MGGGSSDSSFDYHLDPRFDGTTLSSRASAECLELDKCSLASERLLDRLEDLRDQSGHDMPRDSAEHLNEMSDVVADLGRIWEDAPNPVGHRRFTSAHDLRDLSPGDKVIFLGFDQSLTATSYDIPTQDLFSRCNLAIGDSYEIAAVYPYNDYVLDLYNADGISFRTHWRYFGLAAPLIVGDLAAAD